MSYSSYSSHGCSSCGGTSYPQLPPARPYDPCAGGLALGVRSPEKSCGCGKAVCTCGTRTARAEPKNYNAEDCPTFCISCETKQALRDCVKTALCDFLRCTTETLCPGGRFDLDELRKRDELGVDLINCVGQLACSFMHCLPDALCPEPCAPEVPPDCLPCDYAVEVLR